MNERDERSECVSECRGSLALKARGVLCDEHDYRFVLDDLNRTSKCCLLQPIQVNSAVRHSLRSCHPVK